VKNQIILDTGPLVALLNRADRHHRWAREQWAQIAPPLFTCEAVLAEACFLVQSLTGGQAAVLDLVGRGRLDVSFRLSEESAAISRLLKKYQDVPMSFADGCIVRLAERHARGVVFTLDSDFVVYRKNGRQLIPILAPAS
jgi:predicted nucleic acid-binding protein